MNAPADEIDPNARDFKPQEYRGVAIQQAVAGRIGTPPGRPLYQYSCVVYGRRLARTSLIELQRAIDESLDS
ncbi:MAG TPA: hypothetical protein VHC22_30445 [Pirellulales bacterium]|nr:hypothetical protein [Pirellulales bacterium]